VAHTPGPYSLKKRTTPGKFVTDELIVDKRGDVLAKLHCNSEGNGPLFATAPELLHLCEELFDLVRKQVDSLDYDYDQIVAVIRKAKGETE